MGEAKQRGNREERKLQALHQGRGKAPKQRSYKRRMPILTSALLNLFRAFKG